jgi:hypothetical protein
VNPARQLPIPKPLLIWLLVCGTGGPLIFDTVYTLDGSMRPGYNPVRDAITTLMTDPNGWIQQANFVLLGLLTLGVAVVWRRILKGGVCETWYPIARGVEGLSLVAIGFSLTDPIHTAWLFVIIGAMMVGLFIIARRFWGDREWRGWVGYSVASAVLINVLIALFGIVQHTPLRDIAGILERLATNIEPLWGFIVFLRLWGGVGFLAPASGHGIDQ